jgi:SpoVK/Ycf46/Vps4 family AAA+-type ATPase
MEVEVKLYYDHEAISIEELKEIDEILRNTIIDNHQPTPRYDLGIISQNENRIDLNHFSLKNPPTEVEPFYNDDFMPIHNVIMNKLNTTDSKGIVLLYGLPGTGKTNYIRYLIANCKKEKIYFPVDMAHLIARPDFITFLTNRSNAILIIEDAENVIQQRNGGGSGAIANLLNLTDGLLSDCMNIQVVCTFNTDISKIDKALTRKGRLISAYNFKELSVEKCKHLINKYSLDFMVDKPMTLAEIFNNEPDDNNVLDVSYLNGQKQMGFKMPSMSNADDYIVGKASS